MGTLGDLMAAEAQSSFTNLFRGRTDAYGKVWGESVKSEVTDLQWRKHLEEDGESLGIYPLIPIDQLDPSEVEQIQQREAALGHSLGDWWVRWGCTDIDLGYEESWPLAMTLYQALSALGITGWVEKTKGKGYHVWVFAEEPVPAEVMRRALLAAHQAGDVPVDEVNPKQTDTDHLKVGLGNYVNLPYPKGYEVSGKRVMIDMYNPPHLPLSASYFVEQATWTERTPWDTLVEAAKLYQPPPPKERVHVNTAYDGKLNPLVHRLSGLGQLIFREGPLEGGDRSSKLAQLAHLCYEAGIGPSEAFALLVDADNRWGKFADRDDQAAQLERLVDNAY